MKFTKMHGCGNDYVYVDCTRDDIEDPEKTSVFLSNRHFGVGSDGLILIKKSDEADFTMSMYNADGSLGEMCGNGIRCVGKYVYDHGLTDKKEITVSTLAGIKKLNLNLKDGVVSTVRVDMGSPELDARKIPVTHPDKEMINAPMEVSGELYKVTCVSMGNPHCVTFLEKDVRQLDLLKVGPSFENHPIFPKRVNTEFVNIINKKELRMRVWERGSGETLACGTGACAVCVAAVKNHLTDPLVTIHLRGGDLVIEYDEKTNEVYMTGSATEVFTGEITIPDVLPNLEENVKIYSK